MLSYIKLTKEIHEKRGKELHFAYNCINVNRFRANFKIKSNRNHGCSAEMKLSAQWKAEMDMITDIYTYCTDLSAN